MRRRVEDKANGRRRAAPPPRHAPHARHGVDFFEVCDGAAGALCSYRPATAAEAEKFRHARTVVE